MSSERLPSPGSGRRCYKFKGRGPLLRVHGFVMPEIVIDSRCCKGWGTLFTHVDRYSDGGIYEAVLLTPHGFVWCQATSKEAEGESAGTVMYFVSGGRIFSTSIEGKQYKPKGMVKLARQFANQCVEA